MGKKQRNVKKGKNERDMQYMDADTGEVMEVEQTTKLRYGSEHFWKCYMGRFLKVMESLSGRQFHVFVYIVKNTKPGNNLFIGTYDKIVEGSKCSRQTVAAAMTGMQEAGFIRKVQNGVWMVNPYILMQGNDAKRSRLAVEYAGILHASDGKEDGAQPSKDEDRASAQPTKDEKEDVEVPAKDEGKASEEPANNEKKDGTDK